MTEINLSPANAASALRALVSMQRPACLWGAPGIGKSQIVKQTADALGLECRDVRAALLDPVDLRGLPMIVDGRAEWAPPGFLPRDGRGVLFLDELTRASTMTMNACFQLALDRRLGEYVLPDGWTTVVASNRETDGGGVARMMSALANRLVHINVEPNLEDWRKWAHSAHVDQMVLAFLTFRPGLLHSFDKNAHAFPTPRSWEFVGQIIQQPTTPEVELALIAGAVGHDAAVEFLSFVKLYRSLPNMDSILLNPDAAPVPSDVATLYAVSSALAQRATAQNLSRIVRYLNRLPAEYNVYAMRDATTRDQSLTSTPEFTSWAIDHGGVV